jgi:hypothetical protein
VAYELPVGRHLAVDERGVGLRATWRLDHGFINLSLWRDGRCVETFHLTPAAAAELVGFLAKGLADATTVATMARLAAIDEARRPVPSAADRLVSRARTANRTMRTRVAGVLGRAADRLEP